MQDISNKIRELRRAKKLTQEALAEKIGVSAQAVSKWETGASLPDISVLLPLCEALGIGVDNLLGGNRKGEIEEKFRRSLGRGVRATLAVAEEALREFPDDKIWLSRRAHDEYIIAIDENDEHYIQLSTLHYRELHRKFSDEDIYKAHLAELLFMQGKKCEAFTLANKCKEKDAILKKILEGDALEEHKRKILKKKFISFLFELFDYNTLKALELAEKMIKLFSYEIWLWQVYARRAKIYFKNGDMEKFYFNRREAECWANFADEKGAWRNSISATDQLKTWDFTK